MEKGTRVSQTPRAVATLRENGIRACFFVQFGYPGETWREVQKTVQLVRETQPDDVGVSVSYPLPGTKFYERVREGLGEKTNWVDSEDLSMMFRGAYTSDFYRALHDALHAEVESWSWRGPARFRLREASVVDGASSRARLDELWKQVERLEKTCRNSDPTRLPALACS